MPYTTTEIDFARINPRDGSRYAAFEELCCLLASRESGDGFTRKQGKGGDGGIECYVESSEGLVGWQAKYVFEVGPLITQASKSLTTALSVHPNLTKFILCCPFELTGETARAGLSEIEKMNLWIEEREEEASTLDRSLTIEYWPKSKLNELILKHDDSGTIREYFFGEIVLDSGWFKKHVESAFKSAGPRYTPELNVDTAMCEWFAALGRQKSWEHAFRARLRQMDSSIKELKRTQTLSGKTHELDLDWPQETYDDTKKSIAELEQVIEPLSTPESLLKNGFLRALEQLDSLRSRFSEITFDLARAIDERHGKGKSESAEWRQFNMEIAVGFPALHLDQARELNDRISSALEWFRSPSCSPAFEKALVLTGEPGTGKTHGVCDMARRRLEDGADSCVIFGTQFTNERSPWVCITEALGLSTTIDRDCLLDMLNAAGESSGFPFIVFLDAINETKPLKYWQDNLASIVHEFESRPFLRLCVVCRTGMVERCVPAHLGLYDAEHQGFENNAREACESFFKHYGLTPPISPILPRELSNPLYLRLVCETLRDGGLTALPVGWNGGGVEIFAKFLEEKSNRYSSEFEMERSRASSICLKCIAQTIASEGVSSIPWGQAKSSISSLVSSPDATLRWLINEGLLIEDASTHGVWVTDSNIRLAFERLGDFLVASAILDTVGDDDDVNVAKSRDGAIYPWLKDHNAIAANRGILSELSSLIWTRFQGVELTDFAVDEQHYIELADIVIDALMYRETESLTDSTRSVICEAIADIDRRERAFDAMLGCAWRKSHIDAVWMHELLSKLPMVSRDSFWAPFLHKRYESDATVRVLISAAFDLSHETIEHEVAELWVTTLLWFTAASDRRVKDYATRAATTILRNCPELIPSIVERFIEVNDDEVRERSLLACYGSLLLSRDAQVAQHIAIFLVSKFKQSPADFDNALLRDHMRCICDLATRLTGADGHRFQPDIFTETVVPSAWPLQLPSKRDAEEWGRLLRFDPNEFSSDFFKYTMHCLDPWKRGMSGPKMAKWIAQRVVKDFGYSLENVDDYENLLLESYGGGRGKPVWAERLAKKYMWIGLYQLASRLHNNVQRYDHMGNPGSREGQLILPSMRQLDPTVPFQSMEKRASSVSFPFEMSEDLEAVEFDEFPDWICSESVPQICELVRSHDYNGQLMQPVVINHVMTGKEKDSKLESSYREQWICLHSYLTTKDQLRQIQDRLDGQDLFGDHLPNPGHFYDGFLGEYPWGIAFDMEQYGEWEEDMLNDPAKLPLNPIWASVSCDREYDATQVTNSVFVPSPKVIVDGMVWDGLGGFRNSHEELEFLDPSIPNSRFPESLLVRDGYLTELLDKDKVVLVWTLKGQKTIVEPYSTRGEHTDWGSQRFCQFGYTEGTDGFFGVVSFFNY